MMENKRYEVIADYPNSPYSIGQIIDTPTVAVSNYPHIFRPMNWWEGVKIEDMPKWVKLSDDCIFHKCEWITISDTLYIIINDVCYSNIRNYHPATESEYLAYIASLKK